MTDLYRNTRERQAVAKAYLATLSPFELIDSFSEHQKNLMLSYMKQYNMSSLSDADFEKMQGIAQWVATHPSATQKDFDDMLSQVSQPKGGTENMTNVASPGQPPGKVAAVPGESGGYGDKAETLGKPSEGWTDPRGRYSSVGAYAGYQQAAGAFVSGQGSHSVQTQDGPQQPYGRLQSATDNPRSRAHLSHGPVGEAGGNARENDYQTTRPGDVHPRYRQFPTGNIPDDNTPTPASAKKSLFIPDIGSSLSANTPKTSQTLASFTRGKPTMGKPVYKQTTIAPIVDDWVAKRLSAGKRKKGEEDIAGDYEGDALTWPNSTGPDKAGSPDDDSPNRTFDISGGDSFDNTSTGDQGDYGADFSAVDDPVLEEEARKKRATDFARRFLANKNGRGSIGYKSEELAAPIKISEAEEDEENDNILREASRLEQEADELESKGYKAAAYVRRERATKLRKRLPSNYLLKKKLFSEILEK